MVALLFGNGSHTVHEVKRLHKIGEGEGPRDVVLVDDLPVGEVGKLFVDFGEFLAFEGWYTTAAWNASLAGKFRHEDSVAEL